MMICSFKLLAVIIVAIPKEATGRSRNNKDLKDAFTNHRLNMLENGFNVFAKEFVPKQEFTEHRLELLETGFNTFANELLPSMKKMQSKMQFVTETNKELYKRVEDVSNENEHIVEELVRQETVISDLLWAATELKRNGEMSVEDKTTLSEIEWSVFDLKHSTLALLEDICLRESECSPWSVWGQCSVSCGSGTAYRTRRCTTDGKFKSYCNPVQSETTECVDEPCRAIINGVEDSECPENFVSFRGYCFRFSDTQSSRLLSNIMCETYDAHLVEINSPWKQAIVMEYVRQMGKSYIKETDVYLTEIMNTKSNDDSITSGDFETQIAIDGIRHRQETDYLNWKEIEMTFFNWAKGQPRNDKSDGDYCITMNPENGDWYLRCCSKRFYYICEAPPGGIY